MNALTIKNLLLAILSLGVASGAPSASFITSRLDDPKAVYLSAADFGAQGDGRNDDSGAIQAAIDKAEALPTKELCLSPPAATG